MKEKEGVQDISLDSIEIEPLSDEDLENVPGGADELNNFCSAAYCSSEQV